MRHEHGDKVNPRTRALLDARLHDPFSVLGLHKRGDTYSVRVYEPRAHRVWLHDGSAWEEMREEEAGLFHWTCKTRPPVPYRVQMSIGREVSSRYDAYAFRPAIADEELYLFNEGRLLQAYRMLGAHYCERDGVTGFRFACWAPNAERVSVVGEFNAWDGRVHPMAVHGSSGVWELFIPEVGVGTLYRYEIRHRDGRILLKSDPYARAFEWRPGTASRTVAPSAYAWRDQDWMQRRAAFDWAHAPVSIYEVHAGSWREIFNSDSHFYGGSDCGNGGAIAATDTAWMGRGYSASITLPPLTAIILQPSRDLNPPGIRSGE